MAIQPGAIVEYLTILVKREGGSAWEEVMGSFKPPCAILAHCGKDSLLTTSTCYGWRYSVIQRLLLTRSGLKPTMSGVLEGIKVIEVTVWAFVPSAGAALAEWGAEVVKIESLEGDPVRGLVTGGVQTDSGFWDAFNRNKRTIALDLKAPDGQRALREMIAGADVFLTSVLPDSRPGLGIDLESIRSMNPSIVYAAGTATGPQGPDARKGGNDFNSYWSRGGVSLGVTPEGHDPLGMPSGGFGDSTSGLGLAGGIAAALVQKVRTGEGSIVESSLLGTALWGMQMATVSTYLSGMSQLPRAGGRYKVPNPLYNYYPTADGRWVALCMLQSDKFWQPLCRAIGREDLVDDRRFLDSTARAQNVEACVGELDKTFTAHSLEHWTKQLATEPLLWEVAQRTSDLINDPQTQANGYIQLVENQDGRAIPITATPIQFDRHIPTHRAAPTYSQNAEEILAGLGWTGEEIINAKISGAIA